MRLGYLQSGPWFGDDLVPAPKATALAGYLLQLQVLYSTVMLLPAVCFQTKDDAGFLLLPSLGCLPSSLHPAHIFINNFLLNSPHLTFEYASVLGGP